ncbi:diguanylate cyclase (GGDEF) domain protein [Bacteroides pectinophilus CAG:437]|nr:diguanylate cyclase (GGDEF) domain protein [Bacteroides pectinophilus CAG:437]
MKNSSGMTMQQVQDKMNMLRDVFTVVRLLDVDSIAKVHSGEEPGEEKEKCSCYDYWQKKVPCKNCISAKCLHDKTRKTKLELIGSDVYQVTAEYLEIEGTPYVMELIEKLDDDTLIDSDGCERLVSKLSGYTDKLYRDALTGAYNRRYYEDEARKETTCAGVALIDLDDFKLYNDTYGHSAGDMALISAADAIRKCIRKTDRLIRFGGDEFIVIIDGVSSADLSARLRQIQTTIHAASVPGYSRIQMSASIGGVVAANEPVENAFDRADKLMYQAKMKKNMVITENDIIEDRAEPVKNCRGNDDRPQILIVDDAPVNRELLADILGDRYRILQASEGEECINMLRRYENDIALVLIDMIMPKKDGFEVLVYMNRNHWIEDIPVIMISTDNSDDNVSRAYSLGVSDYISSPFDAKVVYNRVFNIIKLYSKQRRLVQLVTEQIYEKEKDNQMMIGILSHIVEFRNGESGSHVLHINKITGMLLERLIQKTDKYDISWHDRYLITTASALHDIGKIGVDEKILNKPGRLTADEFEIMKMHTMIGASMLHSLTMYQDEELVRVATEICRWHHERYDGRGYPDGLKGDEIPISAQVVSVADVYDALASERVYKKAFPHEKAIEMIMNGECGTFNPLLLECLNDIQGRIKDEMDAEKA